MRRAFTEEKKDFRIRGRRRTPDVLVIFVNRKSVAKPAPPEVQAAVREILRRRGPRGAAKALGISRPTVLATVAGVGIHPGSLALLRESLRARAAKVSTSRNDEEVAP